MMMRIVYALLLLGPMVISGAVRADVVIPDERVQNGVAIRSQPTSQSASRGLLRPNQSLPFEGAVPRWNRVRLQNGDIGFISKSWTDVISEPTEGTYTIHGVDVGTGLAIVVEAPDFVLVYDGGSNDDLSRGNSNRLLAYLRASFPNLQTIHHLVLSHPHRDHVELLPDLFDNYQIRHVWDSGRLHDICGYRSFLEKVSAETDVTYHNALTNFGRHDATFGRKTCYGQPKSETTIQINAGARITDEPVALGNTGRMTFLHADGTHHSSPNENSVVMRLDLGATRILFMGDAEAGGRQVPSNEPRPNSIEGGLISCCAAQLRSDVLVVGHHGSMTSSRTVFLDAVGASQFIVSSGPKKYGTVRLPDQSVITALEARGTVFRTDINDATCGASAGKIGSDNDGKAGGCDNIRVQVGGSGGITAGYWRSAD